jgi:hypothetical protein
MKLRIFSFVDGQNDLEFCAASRQMFTPFDPNNLAAFGAAAFETIADRPLYRDLQSLYFVWRNLAGQFDYVGFEAAARPLFIDPLAIERYLQDFPALSRLRAQHFVNWQVPVLPVSPPARQDYAAMRNAFAQADYDRIAHWVAGFDVITTPVCDGFLDALRREFFKERWPLFAEILQQTSIFGQLPEDSIMTGWMSPWYNSFIMKSELFTQFIGQAFGALFEFERRFPDLMKYGADLFMERLLGLYLQFLNFTDPLTRISELPILVEMPEEPPRVLPAGFDAAGYLEFNPDVAAAGIPAVVHFLVHGYRELRRWAL